MSIQLTRSRGRAIVDGDSWQSLPVSSPPSRRTGSERAHGRLHSRGSNQHHLRAPSDPDVVRQYVAPGLNLNLGVVLSGTQACMDVSGWGLPYVCGVTGAAPVEREDSIPTGGPN